MLELILSATSLGLWCLKKGHPERWYSHDVCTSSAFVGCSTSCHEVRYGNPAALFLRCHVEDEVRGVQLMVAGWHPRSAIPSLLHGFAGTCGQQAQQIQGFGLVRLVSTDTGRLYGGAQSKNIEFCARSRS